MDRVSEFVQSLYAKFPNDQLESAVELLPEHMREGLAGVRGGVSKNPKDFFVLPTEALSTIHVSWLEEIITSVPKPLQPVVRRAFDGDRTMPGPIAAFLVQFALSRWSDRDRLLERPVEQGLLAELSAPFDVVCDLLGVYSIVNEVRHLVDRKGLRASLSLLTLVQQRFLRSLLHLPGQALLQTSGVLASLRKDPKSAAQRLRREGIVRFAHAVHDEPEHALWTFYHSIDRPIALELLEVLKGPMGKKDPESKRCLQYACQFLRRAGE